MVYFLVKNINLLMLEVILKEDVFAETAAENTHRNYIQFT